MVIAISSYWCLSSDLFLKIPLLRWLESSSMLNNFFLRYNNNSDPVFRGKVSLLPFG